MLPPDISKISSSLPNYRAYQIKLLFFRFLISRKQFEREGVNFLETVLWKGLLIFLLDAADATQRGPMERVELEGSLARYRGLCGGKWD